MRVLWKISKYHKLKLFPKRDGVLLYTLTKKEPECPDEILSPVVFFSTHGKFISLLLKTLKTHTQFQGEERSSWMTIHSQFHPMYMCMCVGRRKEKKVKVTWG